MKNSFKDYTMIKIELKNYSDYIGYAEGISFGNILKAIQEHYPPPTKADREETERKLLEFKKAHPEFFGVIDDA